MKDLNNFINEGNGMGHIERVGNQTLVDTNFVQRCQQAFSNSELVHLGMGDFMLKTPKGEITFNRSGSLDKGIGADFEGRPHRASDNKGGKLIDELITIMLKTKKAVLSGMNESEKINESSAEVNKMIKDLQELERAFRSLESNWVHLKDDDDTIGDILVLKYPFELSYSEQYIEVKRWVEEVVPLLKKL